MNTLIRFFILASLTVCLSVATAASFGDEPVQLRVLSYNIHHGEGVDRKLDLAVLFLATHLDHRPNNRERLASAQRINELVDKRDDLPAILAGDLNAPSEGRVLSMFREKWQIANAEELPTVPVGEPRRQIDYILFRPANRWKTIDCRVLDEAVASDHRAIFAVLQYTSESHKRPDRKAINEKVKPVIDDLDKHCRDETIYMIGPAKSKRLAELVRKKKPKFVVECGTAVGYSGLWMARELKAAGQGKLITIEIDESRANQAKANFEKAGLADVIEVPWAMPESSSAKSSNLSTSCSSTAISPTTGSVFCRNRRPT